MQKIRGLMADRFTGDVAWNIGSLVFLAAGGLIINGVIVSLRGADALGVFNQVYAFYIVLSQIGVGGLQHSVLKQVAYMRDDRDACADATGVALGLIVLLTVPIALLGLALAQPIGDLLESQPVGEGLRYVMPGLIFFAANKVLINVLNGLRRMRIYAVFRSARFVLIPLFIVLIIALDQPASTLPLALTLAEVVLFIVLIVYIYTRLLPYRRPRNINHYVRAHLSYSVRGVLSGVLLELKTRTDVLMLGLFLSDTAVGWYSFAATLAEGFGQIAIAVRFNVDPIAGGHFADGERDKIGDLARQIRRYFWPGMAVLGTVSILAYPVVYAVLAGSSGLGESWAVYGLLAGAHIIVAGYAFMRGILLVGDAPGAFTMTIILTTGINIGLNALLIPPFGLVGAATTTAASIILEDAIIVYLARRLLDVRL